MYRVALAPQLREQPLLRQLRDLGEEL
eukprot:COSAG01_NODE_37102_length_508_cov_1.227384_1_plen_26_part_01